MPGSEVEIAGRPYSEAVIINHTGVSTEAIAAQFAEMDQPVMAEMVRWARETRPSRMGGMFERDRYLSPSNVAGQIRTAREAMSDDVVSGVEESTEALVFNSTSIFAEDEDEEDCWNQFAERIDLDSRLREMWYQTFSDSQCAIVALWGRQDFQPKRKGPDGKRPARSQKFRNLWMPTALSVIDTLKVIPIGTILFGRERYAYAADWDEALAFEHELALREGRATAYPSMSGEFQPDEILMQLIVGRYTPGRVEAQQLMEEGFDPNRMYLLRDGHVFRHALTKPGHKRWAKVRMESIFPLIDLKHQLRQMDRAHLIGGSNFIVLVTRGTDKNPALPQEISQLQASVQVISRTPVMVGPHDLQVQIITPKLDVTINKGRYDVLDDRIRARLLLSFTTNQDDDPEKQGRLVAQGLEGRRLMMRLTLERTMFRRILDRNPGVFSEMPEIEFHPNQISLTFDANWASFILDQRGSNELSRETSLGEFGFKQKKEAILRKREADNGLDDTFKTLAMPGAGQAAGGGNGADAGDAPQDPKQAGRRLGGNRGKGGAAPGSGQGQPARRVRRKSDDDKPMSASEIADLVEEKTAEATRALRAELADLKGRTQ